MASDRPEVIALTVRLSNGERAQVLPSGATIYAGLERPIADSTRVELCVAGLTCAPLIADLNR